MADLILVRRDKYEGGVLNRQTEMTLKCMPEFPCPIRLVLIAPRNMSRVFDADNIWLLESQSGPF